jgi:AcrR family transcriptional regulator
MLSSADELMTRETARKKPGPPKAFGIDAALRAAIIVFWQKGFDGASLTDLTEAMGINRPSLYGTFGDKQALYLRALDWYDTLGELVFIRSTEEVTARGFAERLLHGIADLYSTPDLAPGCFLIQSAMSTSSLSRFAREETGMRRLRNEMALRKHLKQFARSELPSGLTVETLAGYVTAIGNALAIRAADGAKRRALHRIVNIAMSFWPANVPNPLSL